MHVAKPSYWSDRLLESPDEILARLRQEKGNSYCSIVNPPVITNYYKLNDDDRNLAIEIIDRLLLDLGDEQLIKQYGVQPQN